MKKKIISIVLSGALFIGCAMPSLAADRLSHLLLISEWTDGTFEDIKSGDWYYDSVVAAYKMGLIRGRGENRFAPDGTITIAETIKLAATARKLYSTATTDFEASDPWYRTYVDYAKAEHIITGEYPDYGAAATRAQFAEIMAHALPNSMTEPVNTVQNGTIPDVSYTEHYSGAVYELYRAGIMTGSGSDHRFFPDKRISRAEAAAVVARLMLESRRESVELMHENKRILSGEEIFAMCSNAVFYIQMYNDQNERTNSGSGFFINSDGTAVTCVHVLNGGTNAKITTVDGKVYNVVGVYDYDVAEDWAVIKVEGEDFPYLDIGDASTNVGGTTVYSFGSPLGIQNTISQGLVCNPTRIEDGTEHILFSAAISHGSSGGALINKYGEVIGITAATYVYGQNLNLAIKTTYLDDAIRTNLSPLSTLYDIRSTGTESADNSES